MDKKQALLYLNRFCGEYDWLTALETQWKRRPEGLTNTIAYSILHSSPNIKSPVAFFHACPDACSDFASEDWAGKLKKLISQDEQRVSLRNSLIRRGAIPEDNIFFYPHSRLAYNELAAKIEEPSEEYKNKIKSLIRIYGGFTICFTLKKNAKQFNEKVLWHVPQKYIPYHMERVLWDLHGWEELSNLKNIDQEEIPRSLMLAVAQ